MNKRAFATVFLMVFIDLLGFGIIIPILPFYAQSYGSSAFEIGLLMASYSFFQLLFAPLWGRLSDGHGRRPILLACIVGLGISYVFLALAQDLTSLFFARSLGGIFAASIATAFAFAADTSDESHRTKAMGLLGAAMGLGFTIGPGIGAFLSKFGFEAPNYFAAGLCLINFAVGWIWLKEPKGLKQKRLDLRKEKALKLNAFLSVMKHAPSRIAIVLFFFFTLAITQMEVMFAIYMGEAYGFNAETIGYLMFGMGAFMVLIQGGLVGRLAKIFGERALILTGLFLSAASLLVYGIAKPLTIAVIALCLLSGARGILTPGLTALVSYRVKPNLRGVTMGFYQSGASLARILGPVIGGMLYQIYSPQSPFLAGAAFVGLGLIYFFMNITKVPVTLQK